MKKIIKKVFSNQEIRLDNNEYIECAFKSCLLTYSAKGRFRFSGNTVSSDCEFEVRGQAANTIAALQDLYDLGDWGQRSVLATLHQIAGTGERRPVNDSPKRVNDDSLGYLIPDD